MEKDHFETKDILPRSEEFVTLPEDKEDLPPEWVIEMARKAFGNNEDEDEAGDDEDLSEDVGDDEEDRL